MVETNIIRPQEGYQMNFLSSPADIVIGGGAAGVGKTAGILIDPMRYIGVKGFNGVIFRRTMSMIKNGGGIWDASYSFYSKIIGAINSISARQWRFQSGAKITFAGCEYEKDKYNFDGAEIAYLGFDELQHFSKSIFFYLLSRNRTTCGIRPCVRATCNPDPDSWLSELIDWWIAPDGYPILERDGVIRYFMVDNNNYIWGDTKAEVIKKGWHILQEIVEKSGENPEVFVKSITFISGSIYDNQILLRSDPAYLGNLMSQSEEEKARLLRGNWRHVKNDKDIYDPIKFKNIFTNEFALKNNQYEPKRITTDIALKGSDKFIIFVWQGRVLIDFLVMGKSNGNEIIKEIKGKCYQHNVQFSDVCFDNDGVGQFVDGFIDGAIEFNNGGRPKNGENYSNLKAQCFYKSGQAVERGEYYILPSVAEMMYDEKMTLKERFIYERKAIKRGKTDNENKLCLIKKEEMKPYLNGESPDLMDAFGMNEIFYLMGDSPDVSYS
jgi:Terminase large subunit, T4likevirus-type, N-terminal